MYGSQKANVYWFIIDLHLIRRQEYFTYAYFLQLANSNYLRFQASQMVTLLQFLFGVHPY